MDNSHKFISEWTEKWKYTYGYYFTPTIRFDQLYSKDVYSITMTYGIYRNQRIVNLNRLGTFRGPIFMDILTDMYRELLDKREERRKEKEKMTINEIHAVIDEWDAQMRVFDRRLRINFKDMRSYGYSKDAYYLVDMYLGPHLTSRFLSKSCTEIQIKDMLYDMFNTLKNRQDKQERSALKEMDHIHHHPHAWAFCNPPHTLVQNSISRKNIQKVIFSNPATIVIWKDGSKTVVKCSKDDTYDPEKGFAMCLAKKALGNKHDYYNTFLKYLPKEGK